MRPFWQRHHKQEELVNRKELEALVDSTVPEPLNEFMKNRWIGMVMWWHTRSVEARHNYFTLRFMVVVGGVLIPVLTTMSGTTAWKFDTTLVISVVGAIVAACAAWEGVATYGEVWREKRRAAELLKVEGWQYLQRCGKYLQVDVPKDKPEEYYRMAFPLFAAEVENMIAKEVSEYLGALDPSIAQARKASEQLLQTMVEEATKKLRSP